jgi:CheY-like chemotaxis protein
MSDIRTVLVVEDNDFVRMQIASYLKGAGFTVIEASEGTAALEKWTSAAAVDLAIVDIRMDPMGGFEFIKAIRGRNISTPVILVTGDQTPDILEQANVWGVSAVLMKPVEKERLIKMAARAIEIHKKRTST